MEDRKSIHSLFAVLQGQLLALDEAGDQFNSVKDRLRRLVNSLERVTEEEKCVVSQEIRSRLGTLLQDQMKAIVEAKK